MPKLGTLTPADLNHKRVGIRSFTTTTGAWLRGILANDYGVDLNSIHWVTFEDAHVAEFRDTTVRAPQDKQIIQMLLDGELDAVLGEKSEHPGLKPLFPDAAAEEKSWFAKHDVVPINHMVVVSETLSTKHPDAVREVFRLLQQSAALCAGRIAAVQRRRNAPLAGNDYSIYGAAGAYSPCLRGGRVVRRSDADAALARKERRE